MYKATDMFLLLLGPSDNLANMTPLYQASYDGDAATVASLLNSGVSHLAPDPNGKTALHWAVFKERYDVVQVLLEYHANWKERTISGSDIDTEHTDQPDASIPTPLELAAESNNVEIFNLLLDNLELDTASPRLYTLWEPITFLWTRPHSQDSIRFINNIQLDKVETQAPVKKEDQDLIRQNLLHICIRDDKFSVFRYLLQQGTDPNHTLQRHRSPLHTAVACLRSPRYIRELLQHGADPDFNDGTYRPLHVAVMDGNEGAITELLEGGASPNALVPHMDRTPLFVAFQSPLPRGPLLRLTRQLIGKGADVNASGHDGRTVLHVAAQIATLDVIQELVASNADVTAVDGSGESVLHCLSKQIDIYVRKQVWDYLVGCLPPGYTTVCDSALTAMFTKLANASSFLRFVQAGFSFYHPPNFRFGPMYKLLEDAFQNRSFPGTQYILEIFEDPDDYRHVPFATLLLNVFEDRCMTEEQESEYLDFFLFLLSRLAEPGLIHDASRALNQVLAGGLSESISWTLIQALLDCGVNYQYIDNFGHDIIAHAAIHGKEAILSTVLDDLPSPGDLPHWLDSFNTVRQSCPDNMTAVFSCMMKAGTLNSPHGPSHELPISIAIQRGDLESVRKMISCGADIEVEDEDGWRPLHSAVLLRHEALVDVLLEAGANVNAAVKKWPCDNVVLFEWRGRPLHIAAMLGHAQLARKLIACGADVNATSGSARMDTYYGPTALHIVQRLSRFQNSEAISHDLLSIAQLLVDHGANPPGITTDLGPADSANLEVLPGLLDSLTARNGIKGL